MDERYKRVSKKVVKKFTTKFTMGMFNIKYTDEVTT